MSRKLTSSIALTAFLAALTAAPAFAQQSAPEAPAAQSAPAEAVLPQLLRDAELSDVTREPMRRGGSRITGKLPDGTVIGAYVDAGGALRGLRNQAEAALPADLIAALVPQNVRDNPIYSEISQLRGVYVSEKGVKLAGIDAQDNRLHAAFAEDGTLVRFGRGDDDGDRPGMGKKRGEGKYHDEGKGRHGKRHEGGKHGERGERGGDRGERHGMKGAPGEPGPRGPQDGAPPPAPVDAAPVDEAALRQSLADNGYSEIGTIASQGPRIVAEAVNPEGEAVTLELNPGGEVLREINR